MESISEISARLENIRGLEPIFVALRSIALSSLRAASRRLESADLYYSELARVYSLILEHLPFEDRAPHESLGRCALLIVGNQGGLCGPFATAVVDAAERTLERLEAEDGFTEIEIMVLGERTEREVRRRGLLSTWERPMPVTSVPPLSLASELAAATLRRYEAGDLSAFYAVYNDYMGGGGYRPGTLRLVPPSPPSQPETAYPWPPPILETDVWSLHRRVVLLVTELSFYRMLLRSTAAEQSARFQLMEGASDNSQQLIEELTLAYQMARQEAITEEMLELAVSAGLIRRGEG